MTQNIRSKIQAITSLYKHFTFTIGGSVASYLQGNLNREPNDIDLLVDSREVFDKIRQFTWQEGWYCTTEKGEILNYHWQFWYKDCLFCLFYTGAPIPYTSKYVDNCAGLPIRVASYEDCLLNKVATLQLCEDNCECKSHKDLSYLVSKSS